MEEAINPDKILVELQKHPENEVVEFKKAEKGKDFDDVGKYFSALSNEANLRGCHYAWLVFGIDDKTHKAVGTRVQFSKDFKQQIGQHTTNGLTFREIYEVEQNGKRVVLMQIPAAPAAMPIAWKGYWQGRRGESIVPLDIEKLEKIRSQSGLADWSAEVIQSATFADIDSHAVSILKKRYAKKQNNDDFLTLSDEQVLRDLELITENGITNAAVLLVGTDRAIHRYMPHATVILEYRENEADIEFKQRAEYKECFYLTIDKLWEYINIRNTGIPIHEGAYIYNIPAFNESVIREAICNAVAHRSYKMSSETVIKLYSNKITLINAGGFPLGVTKDNLLTVPSTPRNRLLSDVLAKTGIVERSGQGVDKIYRNTLSEGKDTPDYSNSNAEFVELTISAVIRDKAFALFIKSVQDELSAEEKLSVFDIIALEHIRKNDYNDVNREVMKTLIGKGLVEKRGQTRAVRYHLSRKYYEFIDDTASYYNQQDNLEDTAILPTIINYLTKHVSGRMGDFETLFFGKFSRKQMRTLINGYVERKILIRKGTGSGTRYEISHEYTEKNKIMLKALQIGLQVLHDRGEISILPEENA